MQTIQKIIDVKAGDVLQISINGASARSVVVEKNGVLVASVESGGTTTTFGETYGTSGGSEIRFDAARLFFEL